MNRNSSEKLLVALRRIEGQVRGLQDMIEDNRSCLEIVTQFHAVKGALGKVEEKMLKNHFHQSFKGIAKETSEANIEQKVQSLIELIHLAR